MVWHAIRDAMTREPLTKDRAIEFVRGMDASTPETRKLVARYLEDEGAALQVVAIIVAYDLDQHWRNRRGALPAAHALMNGSGALDTATAVLTGAERELDQLRAEIVSKGTLSRGDRAYYGALLERAEARQASAALALETVKRILPGVDGELTEERAA